MSATVLSVVVPAHNEATTLARLLAGLAAASDQLEVIVVANGCTDDTAARARAAAPWARVVEITTASKIAALNAGDDAATVFPRAYVDADVTIDAEALLALASSLAATAKPLVASPSLVVDTDGASWPARAFYRIWELTDYRTAGHIGSGVYALNRPGRERFGRFPDVIADDRFVQQQFDVDERLTLPDHSFAVRSPRTLRAQIRRATRIAVGNLELPADLQRAAPSDTGSSVRTLVSRVLPRPTLWPAFAVYVVGYLVPAIAARRRVRSGRVTTWLRDDTTRA